MKIKSIIRPLGVVIVLIGMAMPIAASASCDDLSNSSLTDEQLITLKQQCVKLENDAKNAAASASVPVLDKDHLEEYADLGKKYGIALSEVAKSVGTTVNDLAQTPVGIFMLVMVAWKVLGHDLLGIFGGLIWFLCMVPLLGHYFNKLVLNDRKIIETFDPTTKVLVSRNIAKIEWTDGQSTAAWMIALLFVLMCACGFIMIF